MRKALVTGGAGFIGSCLIRQMVRDEFAQVLNLDSLTYAGNLDSLRAVEGHDLYTFVESDIGDRERVRGLLDEFCPEAVINLAAESHVDRSIDSPGAFIQTNVVGTFELLEAVRGFWGELPLKQRELFRFLHVSTDEVYGSLGPAGAFVETSSYQPNSPYAASKAASDHLVRAYQHTYGLPTLITNCSNNYGPYQFPEKLIPLMILNALGGKPLPVYGDGQNVRDWLYVEDHCHALRAVLVSGRPGDTYNIGGSCERTNLEVVNAICNCVDQLHPGETSTKDLITFVKDRPGHDQRYAIDATKLCEELGWQPQEDFETGLKRTVSWYVENAEWVERVTSGVYRRERLGLCGGADSIQ